MRSRNIISKSILPITTMIIVVSTIVALMRNESSVNSVNTEKTLITKRVDLIHKKSLSSKYQYQINHNAYGETNTDKAVSKLQNHR